MSKPIRVCEVVGPMIGGGVEAVVMNYYRHLDHFKVQCDFIITDDSTVVDDNKREIETLGGRLYVVPNYHKLPAFESALYKLFKSHSEWKIVHSHMNALSVFVLRQAKKAGVSVRIAHSHSTWGGGEIKKNAAKAVLRPLANKYPTECFACSRSAGEWLFGKGAEFEVMYNAIDLERFWFQKAARMRMRAVLHVDGNAFVVGHVGRFMPQKNHQFLLEVFEQVAKYRDDAVLVLVGTGGAKASAESWVRERGLESKVKFLGQREDVNELYQAFDAFVLPSLYEGLGIVGIEAQASGLPCLLSDRITREVDVTRTCQFLPIENLDVWVDALCTLKPKAEDERAAIDRARFVNYDIVQQGQWLTNRYLDLYRSASE